MQVPHISLLAQQQKIKTILMALFAYTTIIKIAQFVTFKKC